jgi:hypothetical protein
MGELAGARRRIDILRDVLGQVTSAGFTGRVWQFNSYARQLAGPPYVPEEPQGGTDLAYALLCLAEIDAQPYPLVVISDGEPNDGPAALEVARKLNTRIVTRFVGPDDDFTAIAFMRALAWCSDDGMGDAAVHQWDRAGALTKDLADLLLTWEGEAP